MADEVQTGHRHSTADYWRLFPELRWTGVFWDCSTLVTEFEYASTSGRSLSGDHWCLNVLGILVLTLCSLKGFT